MPTNRVVVVRESDLTIVFSCGSVAEAEQWIADRAALEPELVHAGGYSVDAPEEFYTKGN